MKKDTSIQITLDNDLLSIGEGATLQDLEVYATNLCSLLEKEFQINFCYILARTLEKKVQYTQNSEPADYDLLLEIQERIRQISTTNEWVNLLGKVE